MQSVSSDLSLPSMTGRSEATREALVAAARRLLHNRNATLSMETVSREAGISKGGLLHHFRTRAELLGAVRSSLLSEFRKRLEAGVHVVQAARGGEARPGDWLRAYIELSFRFDETNRASYATLASLMVPGLTDEVLSEEEAYFITRAEQDGVEPSLAQIIRLACDALWSSQNSGRDSLDADRLAALHRQLLRLTEPASEQY